MNELTVTIPPSKKSTMTNSSRIKLPKLPSKQNENNTMASRTGRSIVDLTKACEDNKGNPKYDKLQDNTKRAPIKTALHTEPPQGRIDEESASWSAMLNNPENAKIIQKHYNQYKVDLPTHQKLPNSDITNRFSSYMNNADERQINEDNLVNENNDNCAESTKELKKDENIKFDKGQNL